MIDSIKKLKQEKNALIIAHYYQDGAIQDLADYVGDSLGMAQYAQQKNNPLVVVCGVRFMAESIKAMNMNKKVILPDLNAGCSLADSCTPQIFAYFKAKHPNAKVITYVNSSLEIKAMSDVIVTSSNAVKITNSFPKEQELIFGPDQHLGKYVAKQTGRDLILFPGNCFVHQSFSAKEMIKIKIEHPDALIIAHPECEEAVLNEAAFIGSTSQLLAFVQNNPAQKFIVMTEAGIIHQMKKACPDKEFIMGPDFSKCACHVCPHMRLNTLEKIRNCLTTETPEILIDPILAKQALQPLQVMMELSHSFSPV